jgi:hemolysin activation/secretion protein
MRALWACLSLLLAHPLWAQTADPLLERQRVEELESRTNELGGMQPRGGAPDPGPAQQAAGPCFQIDRLTMDGATILPAAELAAIIAAHVPGCLQGADLQALMRKIDAAYAEGGYITTRTYIPPQNLTSGELRLSVVEGRIEGVYLIDGTQQIDSLRGARQLATAFGQPQGQVFQLRDFEQGLDQMNRLRSVDATLQLQPGAEVGGSNVIVQRLQTDRFRGYARLDNMGSRATGQNTLALDAEVDDLFGANDTLTFGLSGSQNTNAVSLSGSVPFGYVTVAGNLGYSEYISPLNAFTELFGTTRTVGLDVDHLIARDQFTTTALRYGLNLRRGERFINAARLTPQDLTTAELGIRHLRLGTAARNSFDATLTLGLGLFGADRRSADDAPEPQFAKLSLGWQRQAALGTMGTLVQDLRLQISPDRLYGAEQMSIGSYSTVRGYAEAVGSGDSGVVLRSDLYLDPAFWTAPFAEGAAAWLTETTQAHVFVDAGVVWDNSRRTREGAMGAGMGLSWTKGRLTATGILAAPLLEGGRVRLGDGMMQVRVDVKGW